MAGKEDRSEKRRRCHRYCCCCDSVGRKKCTPVCALIVFLIVIGLLAVVFFITLAIGSAVERMSVEQAPNTSFFYDTPTVCAAKNPSASVPDFANYSSQAEADVANASISNCGACGECSTLQDMSIYLHTRNNLTDAATACAVQALTGGRQAVSDCFQQRVGFTPGCNECWVDNVLCTQRHCVFTCLLSIISGEPKNVPEGQINNCLECDEKMCGPAFTWCAGANRRRCGIRSDITRDNDEELCGKIGAGYAWSP